MEGEAGAVGLRWPGWLFPLGQSLGNGNELSFPRHGFYLDGANTRQQVGERAYAMGKNIVKIMGHGDQVKISK